MDLNDHLTVQHSSEVIQIEELDEEPILQQSKKIIRESAEADIVQPIEPSIDEFFEAPVEGTIEDTVEEEIEEARTEDKPEDHIEEQYDEEIRCEETEDIQAPEPESTSAESMAENQTRGAKSPEHLVETPLQQPDEDDSSNIPFFNMSYEESEKCHQAKTEDLENFFQRSTTRIFSATFVLSTSQ